MYVAHVFRLSYQSIVTRLHLIAVLGTCVAILYMVCTVWPFYGISPLCTHLHLPDIALIALVSSHTYNLRLTFSPVYHLHCPSIYVFFKTSIYTSHNMSENGNPVSASVSASRFTERELQLLGWAMQSLKSGPPDVS